MEKEAFVSAGREGWKNLPHGRNYFKTKESPGMSEASSEGGECNSLAKSEYL